MKKWIMILLAMVFVINLAAMTIGCGKKEEPKAPAKAEEAKPAEAKPADTAAPAAPAGTAAPAPAPAAPEATKK